MNSSEESPIDKLRRLLGTGGDAMSSMAGLSAEGGTPIEQTQMAPEGLEWLEDVSDARWIEESLSKDDWPLSPPAKLIQTPEFGQSGRL